MDPYVYLVVVLLIATVIAGMYRHTHASVFTKDQTNKETLESSRMLDLRPSLWWFVDDEVNSRKWWDFGSRTSRHPNRGYLQLALQCVEKTQSADFAIRPLIGRDAVSAVLKEAGAVIPDTIDQMPVWLWRQWALSNLLSWKGGLAMVGDSVLCVGPSFGPLVKHESAATFGIFPDEARALPGSTVGPAPWIGWSAKPQHVGWDSAAQTWMRLAVAGPTSWTAAEARRQNLTVWDLQKEQGVSVLQAAEGGRRPDGYERTMEDLLSSAADPADPKLKVGESVVYIPMDGDKLVRSYRYSWFVRMSTKQILESEFVWATLARNAVSS